MPPIQWGLCLASDTMSTSERKTFTVRAPLLGLPDSAGQSNGNLLVSVSPNVGIGTRRDPSTTWPTRHDYLNNRTRRPREGGALKRVPVNLAQYSPRPPPSPAGSTR